jgi:hypothetical protein
LLGNPALLCFRFCEVGIMAPPKKSAKGEIELLPNPWETFERAVDVVAKSPPQHRVAKKKRKAARKTKKAGHKTP